jgi:TolA-binding protein
MRAIVLALVLLGGCAPCLCPARIDLPPRLQLREPFVELQSNPFFEGWANDDQALAEADRAVRQLEEQLRSEARQITIWNAEIQLNELQDQIDTLETP